AWNDPGGPRLFRHSGCGAARPRHDEPRSLHAGQRPQRPEHRDDTEDDGGVDHDAHRVVVAGFAVVGRAALVTADVRDDRGADHPSPPGKPEAGGVPPRPAARAVGPFAPPAALLAAPPWPLLLFLLLLVLLGRAGTAARPLLNPFLLLFAAPAAGPF